MEDTPITHLFLRSRHAKEDCSISIFPCCLNFWLAFRVTFCGLILRLWKLQVRELDVRGPACVQWPVATGLVKIQTRVHIAMCPVALATGHKLHPDVRVGVDKYFNFYYSFYYTYTSYVLKINKQNYCDQMLFSDYLCSWCAIDRKINLYGSCLSHSTMETLSMLMLFCLGYVMIF